MTTFLPLPALPGAAGPIVGLREYGVRNSQPEAAFDDIALLAAEICCTPYSSISFIDETREWIKATFGWRSSCEVPKPCSLGAEVVRQNLPLFLLTDARLDGRFSESWLVAHEPHAVFYAAVPLVTKDGHAFGALAVFDNRPGGLDQNQVRLLQALGRQVETLLDQRREVRELATAMNVRSRLDERTKWQADHDSLTGLPNRSLFLRRVEETLSNASVGADIENSKTSLKPKKNVSILFVDLDRFKRINDTLGHAVGDIILREVAARFSCCLRPEDTLARLGGDEFTVLLPDVPNSSYAAGVSQMLLQALRRPFMLADQELYLGASIGISSYPRDGGDASTLLKNADIAMYQAKEKGGYQAYSRRMNADGYQRLIEEGELRRAIEREELFVLYQPVVNLTTGAVMGVEALARWKHPERGLVPPAHFIALAEQSDLIVPLGEFVLRRACADAAFWRRNGQPDLRVAVNLSARQLARPHLGEFVETLLGEQGLPGSALDLELTETALFGSGDSTPATLMHLRELGIRLLVDDFGTGYSSLAYLRRFAVDVIKIDRVFIAGLGYDKTDEALVRALIEMAHALKIEVVAEGVETDEQRNCLLALGCDAMQGYLLSRPITADALRTTRFPGAQRLRALTPHTAPLNGVRSIMGSARRRTPLITSRT
ncbi:MAG: EAL domain-containing protein [Armatimonadota bacterium]